MTIIESKDLTFISSRKCTGIEQWNSDRSVFCRVLLL